MKRSFRYLLLNDCYTFLAMLTFAAVILVGNFLVRGPAFQSLFVIYLNAWPLMCALILAIVCATIHSSYANIAISMGARRQDLFWATQLNFLVYLVFCWVTQLVMDTASTYFHWESMELWGTVPPSRNLTLIPVLLLMMTAGSCLGILLVRRPKLGILLITLSVLLCTAVLVAAMLIGGSDRPSAWGSLPWLIPAISAILALVCDVILWHFSQKIVVR